MTLLADYEGVAVAFSELLWLLVTLLAMFLAILGIAAGIWRRPKPDLAIALGSVGALFEAVSVLYVWWSFHDTALRYTAETAEHFRPAHLLWLSAAGAFVVLSVPIFLGVAHKRRRAKSMIPVLAGP